MVPPLLILRGLMVSIKPGTRQKSWPARSLASFVLNDEVAPVFHLRQRLRDANAARYPAVDYSG